ncbi:hypothetical protein P8V03_03750 [Clostridium sp. A1-XYC3]|uniref:Uncharacterized protein n=1 Tax=Clostridium tanneri TaxID=3037988 RepID=A0ABU4JQ32_9CLOT|nr:hypothetical protein [Clostridium sp. A1-XYC3]MDW8800263.1 hypothetical protein [Clostridium sp. A1-XYC3]
MKRFFSVMTTMSVTMQTIGLYLFFYNKLSGYSSNLVDIVWIGLALAGTLFGILFFKINKEIEKPKNTITIVSVLGIIVFWLMLFGHWVFVLLLIVFAFSLHFYMYRDNKFTIIPVISFVMGIYSIGLYLLMRGITSM